MEAGHDVLDVGSGSGYFTMLAAHLVGESGAVTGIDVSPQMAHDDSAGNVACICSAA